MTDHFDQTSNPQYSQFIALSRYARWLGDKNRRETWEETVDRYVSFFQGQMLDTNVKISNKDWVDVRSAILNLEVMPSMRCLMTAGPALARDNVAGFNCSYIVVDHPRAFDETMYILMCGTGLGFSVERQYVNKLPEISEDFHVTDTVISVPDSKKGWAKSFKELISLLYAGHIPSWDLSKLRPAGARLKTFGGRSSGPDPLDDLFNFTVKMFTKAAGRKLSSIEAHDLMCKIADVVVVGGVRRSALISLSNLSDDRMRDAKKGQFWLDESQRGLANNSACYTEAPEFSTFMKEWTALYESKAGERGLFNREASINQAMKNGRREPAEFGTNPCSEIILRPNQFCNLSEVVVRSTDTLDDLKRKVRIAAILGTLQSSMTKFDYLRSIWRKNTEEEALLGVSLTGIMDNDVLAGLEGTEILGTWLNEMREVAIATNKVYATKIGVNQSAAITCVKPSGTVSQLVDSASGIHDRFSQYYIRTVRADVKDPLAQLMRDKGFPYEVDVTNDKNLVFSFPIKAPDGCSVADDRTAIQQLEHWKIYQEEWCEHKPSVTVYYSDNEFFGIGQWVIDNWDVISGISFLPRTDHVYQQAPYQKITEEKFNEFNKKMPTNVDWSLLSTYEKEDNTTGSQTMACSGGSCELVDIT